MLTGAPILERRGQGIVTRNNLMVHERKMKLASRRKKSPTDGVELGNAVIRPGS